MGFIDHVKGLRRSNAPLPFSSEICSTISTIVGSSRVDLHRTVLDETKIQNSNEIDILL